MYDDGGPSLLDGGDQTSHRTIIGVGRIPTPHVTVGDDEALSEATVNPLSQVVSGGGPPVNQ